MAIATRGIACVSLVDQTGVHRGSHALVSLRDVFKVCLIYHLLDLLAADPRVQLSADIKAGLAYFKRRF